MITPIYRICTACQGKGTVDSFSNPESSTAAIKPAVRVVCEVCNGVGAIPTGDFLYQEHHVDNGKTVLEQIQQLKDPEKRVMLSKI